MQLIYFHVVGKQQFEKCKWRQHFSSYVSKSDVAFVLLVFYNNYNYWMDMPIISYWARGDINPMYTIRGNVLQSPNMLNLQNNTNKKTKASLKKFER